MKYYKLENQVYAFEDDGSQDDYIKPEMVLMTSEEVDKHINPEKYLTEEQKYNIYLTSLKPLTRRQFRFALHNHNLLNTVESSINVIEDENLKTAMQIEYQDADKFFRTSEFVLYMIQMLGMTEKQVNDMWQEGLTL